jgi:hypothetical protein
MPRCLDAKLGILPTAQREIWTSLAVAPQFDFVLYGGTAIALHLGHRESISTSFDPARSIRIRYVQSFHLSAGQPFFRMLQRR